MRKIIKYILFCLFVVALLIISNKIKENFQAARKVMTYESEVIHSLNEHDSLSNIDLVLAMIYTETKGKEQDVMQSSESLNGETNTISDSQNSISQGIALLSKNLIEAEERGLDPWTAVQAYNFGSSYIDFIATHGGQNTLDLAENYSKDLVAPSLGNTEGESYFYYHPIALLSGGSKLYVNGGNIYYSREVKWNLYWIKFVRMIDRLLPS